MQEKYLVGDHDIDSSISLCSDLFYPIADDPFSASLSSNRLATNSLGDNSYDEEFSRGAPHPSQPYQAALDVPLPLTDRLNHAADTLSSPSSTF